MNLDYFYNIALLVLLVVVIELLMRHGGYRPGRYRAFLGVLIGAAAVLGMMNPVEFSPGLIFDGRSVLISVGGFIGGPVTAVISALIAIVYRLSLGGVGALVGVSVIIWSAALGVGFYYLRQRWGKRAVNPLALMAFGVAVHLGMLAIMFGLPGGMETEVIGSIALPVMTIFPIAVLIMCLLFLDQERYYQTVDQLEVREKELHEALANSRQTVQILRRYELIAGHSRDIILFLDATDGRIKEANKAAEEAYGYSREELQALKITDLRAPETLGDVQSQIVKANTDGILFETQHRRRDGSVFPVEVSSRGADIAGHRQLISVIRDITARKSADETQKQLKAKAEMSSRLAVVGEMAAGIAHEINNPLTGIIGFSELLMEQSELPENVRENVVIISRESQRIKDIVRRMLTFARQSAPQKSAVDIHELIDNTLELRKYVLETANIKVIRRYDMGLPWLTVDSGQMQQVFLNILVNAEHAMKEYHGRGEITISTQRAGDRIKLSFKDDGPGITDEVRPKLFQPFFTTKEPGEGTGLGLSLSLGIVQEHGGEITINSVDGQGAEFVIDLPATLAAEPIVNTSTEDYSVPDAGQKLKLLVVDDEPAVRTMVTRIFSGNGHTVDECPDAAEIIDRLASNEYDAILLDIRMPGLSGTELFSLILEKYPEQARRVIFITGDTSDPITRKYLETHRIAYVAKPFDRATLEAAVNRVITDYGNRSRPSA
ncbi:multi-sensor hybrid histidine kinase [Dehalogenimonas lykanthroporepellens BL-DC-9]|nr:multi-sensor hybrid histidine kinase [Dehalogenimonas lykanthroporepellens BL-DC-9]